MISIREVWLDEVKCPVEYNKRGRDGPHGFLDPILYAFSRVEEMNWFCLSARTPPAHSSLLSMEAVRALLRTGRWFAQSSLRGLGLNDTHCIAIIILTPM
jgi:hypothetical protein